MYITNLSLQHFRNFREVESITFPARGLLVAVAPNAVGKTNFLESIYFALRGKSWRAQTGECVQWGEDSFGISLDLKRTQGESRLAARYDAQRKVLALLENGVPASLATFYSQYPLLVFLPDDTFMFYRGPSQRRNFLNTTLTALPHYFSSLVQYHRALRQRNAALKTASQASDLEVWNRLLVEHSEPIWNQRRLFIDFLTMQLPQVYRDIGGEEGRLEIRFVPGVNTSADFLATLAQAWPQETRYKHTLYGAHRDDMTIWYEGHQVQTALSRGQMRLLVIALKIVAYRYVEKLTGEEPLFLLDEVLSELDDGRQRRLLGHLPSSQILLTCTRLPAELKKRADVHMIDLRAILAPPDGIAQEVPLLAATATP